MNRPAESEPRPKRGTAQTLQYLDDMLSMDPMIDAGAMVERRWQFCGLSKKVAAAADPESLAKLREFTEQRLETIRANFWRTPSAKLRKSLDAMQVQHFPELKAGVDRLKRLTLCHDDLQNLISHPGREMNLYNTFRRVVMLPPLKAGEVKEKYLHELGYSPALGDVKKMIKMLRSEFPALYKFESAWFVQIENVKSQSVATESEGVSFDFGIPGWVIWLTAIMVIRFLLILF